MRYKKTGKPYGPMPAGPSAVRAQGDFFSTAASTPVQPAIYMTSGDSNLPHPFLLWDTIQCRVSSRISCSTAAVVRPVHEQEADDNSDADEESKSEAHELLHRRSRGSRCNHSLGAYFKTTDQAYRPHYPDRV